MRKKLYIMCGVPGSGKSTYIKNHISYNEAVVSRDAIRYSLLKPQEDYFSHEKETFNIFCEEIQKNLSKFDAVYADATHINEKSRNKLLDSLDLTNVDVIPINIHADLNVTLAQNAQRHGIGRVPDARIREIYAIFKPATNKEKHKYAYIIEVFNNG